GGLRTLQCDAAIPVTCTLECRSMRRRTGTRKRKSPLIITDFWKIAPHVPSRPASWNRRFKVVAFNRVSGSLRRGSAPARKSGNLLPQALVQGMYGHVTNTAGTKGVEHLAQRGQRCSEA